MATRKAVAKGKVMYVTVYKRKRDGTLAANVVSHPRASTKNVYRMVLVKK